MKLKELALVKHAPVIKSGLVLARKAATLPSDIVKQYPLLLARTINDAGKVTGNDVFDSKEILEEEYLTQYGDVLIKISAPNIAVYIAKENTGRVISSYFCVIRNLSPQILPEYLAVYLNSFHAKMQLQKDYIGTTIQTIKTSALLEIEIPLLPMEEQKIMIELFFLKHREIELLRNLADAKEDYYNKIVSKKFRRKNHGK